MQKLTQIPESKYKIRFIDCDPFKHLNNSRYIDYFMNAREDHILEHYGLGFYEMTEEKGVSWVVSQNRIAYLRPAIINEIVVIQTCIISWNNRENIVEMRMWDENKKHLKALMWTTFAHYNVKTQMPAIHSDELIEIFKQVEIKIEENITFQERINQLKKESKKQKKY